VPASEREEVGEAEVWECGREGVGELIGSLVG